MILGSMLPVVEAAAFTAGCMLIDALRCDSERAGAILLGIASVLALILLIVSTPAGSFAANGVALDEVHSILE